MSNTTTTYRLCRDLDPRERASAAALVMTAAPDYYKAAGLACDDLLGRVAEEFRQENTELHDAIAAVDASFGVCGVIAGYPASVRARRQQGTILHLLSDATDDRADRFLDWLAAGRAHISPLPPESYYVARIAVARGLHGTGVASGLLRRVLDGGYPSLSMHVRKDNARMLAFARRHGFVPMSSGDGPFVTLCRSA